ncbi:hypothetical protein TNCV_1804781 [Trichonephila clavipes]|nr:hypothetical protein TNCV_1804781 [Trichonephila clavipes]
MADRRVFMLGSRSLLLVEWRLASRWGCEAWILTSRKICSEESEWKSESSCWLFKSEDNGCSCGGGGGNCNVATPSSGRNLWWTRHPHVHLAAAAQPLFDPREIEHRRPEDEREEML